MSPKEWQTVPTRLMECHVGTLPDGEKIYKKIDVDECIADSIQKLWDNGIMTLNSCCGHNEQQKSVVISCEEDAQKAIELLPDFEVCYWKLIKENSQS